MGSMLPITLIIPIIPIGWLHSSAFIKHTFHRLTRSAKRPLE